MLCSTSERRYQKLKSKTKGWKNRDRKTQSCCERIYSIAALQSVFSTVQSANGKPITSKKNPICSALVLHSCSHARCADRCSHRFFLCSLFPPPEKNRIYFYTIVHYKVASLKSNCNTEVHKLVLKRKSFF